VNYLFLNTIVDNVSFILLMMSLFVVG